MKAKDEFNRLVQGKGNYTDDLIASRPGAMHVSFVRSPVAHARITEIDTGDAADQPDVIAVFTADEFPYLNSFPASAFHPLVGDGGFKPAPRPAIAADRVRFVGEIVALVIARTRAGAEVAAEMVMVDYDELPPVIGWDPAADAVDLHHGIPGNVAMDVGFGHEAELTDRFSQAACIVEAAVELPRVVANPMEPRSAIATHDPVTGRYHLWAPHQGVPEMQTVLAAVLGVAEKSVAVESVDVGGAFGARGAPYPEHALLMAAAERIGNTLAWQGQRVEGFMSDAQGRGNRLTGKLAVDDNGRFVAIDVIYEADLGAYATPVGALINLKNSAPCITGAYQIPVARMRVVQRYTNAVPTGPYRGAGRPDIACLVERLVDKAAMTTGFDRLTLRDVNLIPASAMPWKTPLASEYDSGDYHDLMRRAAELSQWDEFEHRRQASKREGKLRGIGMAVFVEIAGGGPVPQDQVKLALYIGDDSKLRIDCRILGHSTGQGPTTVFSQLVADHLGCRPQDVSILYDNGQSGLAGAGAFASRSASIIGTAIARACEAARTELTGIAADMAGLASNGMHLEDGVFRVAGGNVCSLEDVLATAVQQKGKFAYIGTADRHETYPSGAHVAEIEIDPATGEIEVVRYTAVDDCGTVLSEQLAEAQIQGGIVQGLGEALGEMAAFDDSGQLLSASFMDYRMPRALDVPNLTVEFRCSPSPRNVLGVKGVGEAGLTGALAATVNAIHHALRGKADKAALHMPFTSNKVWQAINGCM
jgi:carbon-monoxide dehydrogenase large subunit